LLVTGLSGRRSKHPAPILCTRDGFFIYIDDIRTMKNKLIQKVIERNGRKVIQGRSCEGKLLIEKTQEGYELKCPRSKKVYLITYEEMLAEYKELWKEDNNATK